MALIPVWQLKLGKGFLPVMDQKEVAATAFDSGSPLSRTWPQAEVREQSHHFLQSLLGAAFPIVSHFKMKEIVSAQGTGRTKILFLLGEKNKLLCFPRNSCIDAFTLIPFCPIGTKVLHNDVFQEGHLPERYFKEPPYNPLILDFMIKTQLCYTEVSDTELVGNSASGHPARGGVSLSRVAYPGLWELVLYEPLECLRWDNPFAAPMYISQDLPHCTIREWLYLSGDLQLF